MSDPQIVNYPILTEHKNDYIDDVKYEVDAKLTGKNITVTHVLYGKSLVRDLILERKAFFTLRCLYFQIRKREEYTSEKKFNNYIIDENKLIYHEKISNQYTIEPEMTPSIIVYSSCAMKYDKNSGLSEFWKNRDFAFPEYSRIANAPFLSFGPEGFSKLFRLKCMSEYEEDFFRINIRYNETETQPVTIECSEKIYSVLKFLQFDSRPTTSDNRIGRAIITQALCAVYSYVHIEYKYKNPSGVPVGAIADAMDELLAKTDESYESDDFDPCLASTMMEPYWFKEIKIEEN